MDQNHLRPSSPLLTASTETASIKRIGEQEYEFHQQHEQLLSLDSLNYLKLYSLVFPAAACYITSTYWDCYKNESKSISQVLQVLGKSVLIQPFIWILMLSDSCEESNDWSLSRYLTSVELVLSMQQCECKERNSGAGAKVQKTVSRSGLRIRFYTKS